MVRLTLKGVGKLTPCELVADEGADGEGKLRDVGDGKDRPGGEGSWRFGAGGGFMLDSLGPWLSEECRAGR